MEVYSSSGGTGHGQLEPGYKQIASLPRMRLMIAQNSDLDRDQVKVNRRRDWKITGHLIELSFVKFWIRLRLDT